MWGYEKVVATGKAFGRLTDERGWFVSRQKASSGLITKATDFLDELFQLLDKHGMGIYEDSEQGVVILDLGDGFELTYEDGRRDKAEILHHGSRVGVLTKKEEV